MKPFLQSIALASSLVAGTAAASTPEPDDFALGLNVLATPGYPVLQFTVPDRVYEGVTRADLGDLRVFNGGGIVVPHALCTGPEPVAETVSEEPLRVFPLQPGAPPHGDGGGNGDTRVSVQTPAGTSVQVIERGGPSGMAMRPAAPAAVAAPQVFVADATALRHPLRALQLGWSTPDGASQATVRVEASDDLDRWHTVVANTTLLYVAADGRTLDRNRIDLPQQTYRYLRLTRSDGPAVRIERVTAETVQPGAPPEPFWFAANPAATADAEGVGFETGRLAPVQTARVELPSANMALHVALESRQRAEMPWQQRWSGDVSSVRLDPEQATRLPEPRSTRFFPVADTQWRVRVLRGRESLGGGRPTLHLGYHPARLRFLVQGEGPFVVAYGSARVAPGETRGCDDLLAQVPSAQRDTLIGDAAVSAAPSGAFGGPEVLAPAPKPTPVRQIVLWAVLLLGAAALVAMALSLLRRLREGEAAP